MAPVSSTSPSSSFFPASLLLVLLLSSQACSTSVLSRSTVKFLPGFHGPLPFHLETGYVGVGESEGVQLFYYYVRSDRNAKQDPLILWLTGGPGCSALSSIGPLHFQMEEYNGTLPALDWNPGSWTKISSIIFLDLPAHTGFSYTTLPIAPQRSVSKQIQHAVQFLWKWLTVHREFQSNPIYIGGDSYSGMIVPAVALEISKCDLAGNEHSIKPSINLQGYVLGNPATDVSIDNNHKIPFAHGMGLISNELYESLKSSCGGEYHNVDVRNEMCTGYIAEYEKCVSGINGEHILEDKCPSFSSKPPMFSDKRSLHEMPETLLPSNPQPSLPAITCQSYQDVLAHYWASDGAVRKALGIRQGSIGNWVRCIKTPYTKDIKSSVPFHVNLSAKGYRELIYSGDHDFAFPFVGTQAWVRSLNYSIVDEWRPWLFKGQVAGYTRTYSNGMTYATVKGGGHTAPEYKPKECFAMFERWISQKPL